MGDDNALSDGNFQRTWRADTPESLQLISSGVTKMTKWWLAAVSGVGGVTALISMIVGYVRAATEPLTNAVGEPVTVAFIAGGSLVLAASAIALAVFVHGDLEARGAAAAAQLAARGNVMAAFLRAETVAGGRAGSARGADDVGHLVKDLQKLKVAGADVFVGTDKETVTIIHAAP
ncbi:hypothetical protein [Arthrobacter sp. ok909]|uniref:hypothetical protein n=1 Tax=Arthrobacter sp. ok909 TaxID=1761746 RepID=UPI0011142C6B|nr:hypothetical protein [Arthrobacter sp. ok909]